MHYSHLPLIYKITCEPIYIIIREACADPGSFASGGPTLMFKFFCVSGEDPNSTKSGLSSASQQNAIYMAFHWLADDDPTLNADLVAW